MLRESAARSASSPEVSPSKAPEAEDDRAALAKELADVKKRFLAVAKKKQADFAKRVRLLGFPPICTCCCPVSHENPLGACCWWFLQCNDEESKAAPSLARIQAVSMQ